MKKYRKIPVQIEAIKWNGKKSRYNEIKFINDKIYLKNDKTLTLVIPTLEGEMECRLNDYIIKGIKGEFYPCKPDIFKLTYESI